MATRAARLTLENRVTKLEQDMATLQENVGAISQDTSEIKGFIQSYVSTFHGVKGFFKKHGPHVITFATGIAVSAGFVEPKVGAFIRGFFGG
jgi:hypothetical protein